MSNTKTVVWSSSQRQKTYYSDGITKITDPFWVSICSDCGRIFMSCECTCPCPDCGSCRADRRMGDVPYDQVVAERGGSEKIRVCQRKSEFVRENQSLSEKIRINQSKKMKGGVILNRIGFIILSILHKCGATNRPSSMTVREIAATEDLGLKENTIFKKIKDFEQCGYIGRGMKEGRADTYFITPEGCVCLEKERDKS